MILNKVLRIHWSIGENISNNVKKGFIPEKLYRQIEKSVITLCVDVIIKKDGEYLLAKRVLKPYKERWFIPGGRVLRGETIEQAAKRKAFEELGVKIKNLVLCGYNETVFRDRQDFTMIFIAEMYGNKITLDSKQNSTYKWSKKLPPMYRVIKIKRK